MPCLASTVPSRHTTPIPYRFLVGMANQDEDSQAILSLLHCTNSRLGVSGSVGGGVSVGGNDPADASANKVFGGGKRRARDQYTGELDAQEVENGFGMGMSSKVRTAQYLCLL